MNVVASMLCCPDVDVLVSVLSSPSFSPCALVSLAAPRLGGDIMFSCVPA